MNDGPTISGKQTQLLPVTPADLPFLQELWNQGEVMQYVGFPDGLGMTEAKMARWWEECQQWTATHLIVKDDQGRAIGESGWGFMGIPGILDIKLAQTHWGQGFASDVLDALLGHIFGQTRIDQVIVTPHPENQAARVLYRRFGFQPDTPPSDFDCGGCDYWTRRRVHPLARPSTLIFDWGGVLMRTEDDQDRRKWEALLNLPPGGVDQAVFGSEAWRKAQLGRCTVGECWTAIGESLRLTTGELAQFRADFWAGDRLDQALIQGLRRWKAEGYRVAILSNYSPELEALLDRYQLGSLFEPVIISAHEGIIKPASRLFWRALNRIGISPAEALFVDDFSENIAGARSVGLAAVQFRDTRQVTADIERYLA